MTYLTVRQVLCALILYNASALAFAAELTCKWTHPKNPGRTATLTMTADAATSNVTISRGPTNSVVFSSAEIRFNARTTTGWDYKYVLDRTTLTLTEINYTGSRAPIDYVCILVKGQI